MIKLFHNFKSRLISHFILRSLILAGGLIIPVSLSSCSKPTVPVFEANKFRTTTGKIEKNHKEIEEVSSHCEEDRAEIQSTLDKMRSLLAGS